MDTSLNFQANIKRDACIAGGIATNLLSSTLLGSQDFMLNIFITQICSKIEYTSCLWHAEYIGDIWVLESVQRRWTREIDGLREMSYPNRLKHLELLFVQGRLLRRDIITVWKIMHNQSPLPPGKFFTLAHHVGTRGHSLKLASNHIRLEVRRRFFSQRVIRKWNSLRDATVKCVTLEGF